MTADNAKIILAIGLLAVLSIGYIIDIVRSFRTPKPKKVRND